MTGEGSYVRSRPDVYTVLSIRCWLAAVYRGREVDPTETLWNRPCCGSRAPPRSRVIALCTHGASYRCANTPSFWCRPPMLNLACHDGRPMHSVQSRDALASQSLCRFSAPVSNLPGLTPPKITAWPERVISAQRYKQNTIMYTKMSASATDISLPVRHSPRSFLTPRADILPWRTAGPFCDSQLTLY